MIQSCAADCACCLNGFEMVEAGGVEEVRDCEHRRDPAVLVLDLKHAGWFDP